MQITPEEAKIELCRRRLAAFSITADRNYILNWHHRIVADALERVERGECKRLIICEPPQHGKTNQCTVKFPAWYFGKHPDRNIITCSYNSTHAKYFGRMVKRLGLSPVYRHIFGNTIIGQGRGQSAASQWFDLIGGGSYRSFGIGVGISGIPADGLVIDDPIKSRKEANSLTTRNTIWDWYANEAYPRLMNNGWIIIITTRWHEDDLVGRLLEKEKEGGDQWEVINIPAIAEEDEDYRDKGEPLWPEKHSLDSLIVQRNTNPMVFSALYQGRPSIMGGNIFKVDDFGFYDRLPDTFDILIQSWDFTFEDTESGDMVAGGVWGKNGDDIYLLFRVFEKLDFSKSVDKFLMVSRKFPGARTRLIEKAANGAAIMSFLKKRGIKFKSITVTDSKDARASLAAEHMKAYHIMLPNKNKAPWVDKYLENMLNYPKARYDDDVDQTSQAINYLCRPRIEMQMIDLDL